MEIKNYDTLLEEYVGVGFEKQRSLAEVIGSRSWQIDTETGLISFGEDFHFPIQILGTYAYDSETWLWAWANEASDIPDQLLQEAIALKKLGEEHNIEFLTMPEYNMEPTDVHSVGIIASGMFGASAYYAGDFGSGIALVTLKSKEVDDVLYNEQARILTVFPEIISVFAVNNKRALTNYLLGKNYAVKIEGNKLIAEKGSNRLYAEFDDKDRLANIKGEIKPN